MKPGFKTSEFWVVILNIVGSASASIAGVLDPKWAALAASVSTIAYAFSRAFIKSNQEQ